MYWYLVVVHKVRILNKAPFKKESTKNGDFNELTPLPPNFRPGHYDVICGRGKAVLQHHGNRLYRKIINASLRNYTATTTKLEKTLHVSSIIQQIENAGDGGGSFIRKLKGEWYKVSESYVREKRGQR